MSRKPPKSGIDFETVRRVAAELPDIGESLYRGTIAIKARGKMLACTAIHKSAEPGSLMIRMDPERCTELIEGAPETYYVTDHYVSDPCVLIRLSQIDEGSLRDLLKLSWRFVTASLEKQSKKKH